MSGQIPTVEQAPVPPPWQRLRDLRLETHHPEPIRGYHEAYLSIHTPDVLARIPDPSWEARVPPAVVDLIKAKQHFGYRPRSP